VNCSQHRVICSGRRLSIARRQLAQPIPRFVFQRSKVVAQQRESPDVPVIFGFRNGRLQQNANRSVHSFIIPSHHHAAAGGDFPVPFPFTQRRSSSKSYTSNQRYTTRLRGTYFWM